MSYLDQLRARIAEKQPPSGLTKLTQPGSVGFVSEVGSLVEPVIASAEPLPASLTTGVASLRTLPAPRITRPEIWPVIVADACRLVEHGWAAEALALGWQPLELFGCSADPEGDDYLLGLAGWLNGRALRCIFEAGAIAIDGDQRAAFNRKRAHAGAIYLWEYGR
jgi:hypothetical protein